MRQAADLFVETAKQYVLQDDMLEDEALLAAIDQTKGYRDLFMDFCESLIYSGLPLSSTITKLIEQLYNVLHDEKRSVESGSVSIELYDFMIWELFICTTALLLHYEKYADVHDIIIHTYFLRQDNYNDYLVPRSFARFRAYIRTIEEVCKPKSGQPSRYTMQGDMLIQRERKPILTKESISNADIVLYQLGELLTNTSDWFNCWFPTTYVYHRAVQTIWLRLKSEEYCQSILPLFGAKTIPELKEIVKKSVEKGDICYRHAFAECAPSILSSIKAEEVASMN